MAKKKTEEEKVKRAIPRAKGHEDHNLFVGINGRNTIIPKGQTVEVRPEVAELLDFSEKAEIRMYDRADQLKSKT